MPPILAPNKGIFGVGEFVGVGIICLKPTPCYHGNDNLEIITENLLSRLLQGLCTHVPDSCTQREFSERGIAKASSQLSAGYCHFGRLSGCPSVRAINRYRRHQPTASETVPLAG